MIKRIVKLTFVPEEIDNFLPVFKNVQGKIAKFPGCNSVEIFQDVEIPNQVFTLSNWDSVEALNAYRESDLFKDIWAIAKMRFSAKPEAWSVKEPIIK